jgi:hypothetical protein
MPPCEFTESEKPPILLHKSEIRRALLESAHIPGSLGHPDVLTALIRIDYGVFS